MTIENFYSALRKVSKELHDKVRPEFRIYLRQTIGIIPTDAAEMAPPFQALLISAYFQSKGINMPDVCLTPFGLSVHAKVVENKIRMMERSFTDVQIQLAG